MSGDVSLGDRRLRSTIFLIVAIELGFIVFLAIFLWNHADPMGDGMEMVGVGAAIMLVFLPFSLPAFILAKERRSLVSCGKSRGACRASPFRFVVSASRRAWSASSALALTPVREWRVP